MLRNRPVLAQHLRWVWDFWAELNRLRNYNEAGPQPCCFADIETLARLKGLCHNEDISDILFFVPRMEDKFIHLCLKRKEEIRKKAQKGRNKRTGSGV